MARGKDARDLCVRFGEGARDFASLANARAMRYNGYSYVGRCTAQHDDRGGRDGLFFESGKCGL